MKNVLIIILLVLVLIFGYLALRPKTDSVTVSPTPTGQTMINNPTGNDYQPTSNNQNKANPTITQTSTTNNNVVTKKEWGISFSKALDWSITSDSSTKLTLISAAEQAVKGDGDTITLTYISGNSITDTDAKFGNITYYYNKTNQTWMVELPDEQNGGQQSPKVATPAFYTTDKLPVFNGTGRWKTYIVALSPTTFIELNIGGGGYSQPLTDLVKTIKQI